MFSDGGPFIGTGQRHNSYSRNLRGDPVLFPRCKAYIAFALVLLLCPFMSGQQHPMSSFDQDRAQKILQVIANDIKKHYYDPKMHGIDWDAKVEEARKQIASAVSFNMAMAHIAATIDLLNDSHTFLLPPQHAFRLDNGFQYQMVGDRCFVTQVRPKSDAEAKGLKPGDQIVTLNGFNVVRGTLWKMQYAFTLLRPQPALRLGVQDPTGASREVLVAAKIKQEKLVKDVTGENGGGDIWDLLRDEEQDQHLMRARSVEYGDDLMVLRIPAFFFSESEIEHMVSKARKFKTLVIDLRGNPGGSVDTLKYLVGGVFEKEVKIADRVGRKDTKPEIAKPMHNPFNGRLIVLIDARSASAAELFARIIQLEKRGTVIGDLSSGSVMEAKDYEEKLGVDTVIFYGASITEWDLIMTDGNSLEHKGVSPDELLLPTGSDLRAGRDAVLAHAAGLAGVKLTPEDAGKVFPYEWPAE